MMTDEHQLAADVALQQLKGAAAAGCPTSMAALGIVLIAACTGSADEARGYELISRAAELGEPGAHFGLAAKYGQGQGVPRDLARSLAHFLVATRTPGILRDLEGQLRAMLTPEQIVEAEELAAEWAPRRH